MEERRRRRWRWRAAWRMGVCCIAFIQLFFLWPQCASFIYLHLKFINVFSPSIFHLSLFVSFLNSWRVPIEMKLTSKNIRATLSIYIFSALHFANHKTSQHWFLCLLLLLLVQWFGRLRLKSIWIERKVANQRKKVHTKCRRKLKSTSAINTLSRDRKQTHKNQSS